MATAASRYWHFRAINLAVKTRAVGRDSVFLRSELQTSFPLFSKIEVNGAASHPLFTHLKEQAPGVLGSKRIKWNFTKFLVNQQGEVVKRFAPSTKPEAIASDIEALL